MRTIKPQLALRLDAAALDPDAQWRAGATVAYLGETLTLVLDTASPTAQRCGNELHVPLPPAASSRQICDAVESWLRDEALRVFAEMAEMSALGRRSATVKLVFGKRGDWAKLEKGLLRCHWRLIEQPPTVIAQVIGQALNQQAPAPACDDLFALA